MIVCFLFALAVSADDEAAPMNKTNDQSAARKIAEADRVLIIAHRGNSSRAPENTLPAFKSAVEAGADLVELDYFHSADGVPVVFHDKDLARTTNAKRVLGRANISITSLTLKEIRRLDAGRWFNAKFAGAGVPTLEEALDVIQAGSITLIEHKHGDARTLVELLRRKKTVDRVVVQSFDWKFVADCVRMEPKIQAAALGGEALTEARLDEIENTGAAAVGWNHKKIGKREIDAIHRRGLKAWVYTVNDEARARQLIAAGIDGIITDRPVEMRKLCARSR